MAESSRPSAGGGSVVDTYYERLSAVWGPDGLHGLPADLAPVYCDGTGGLTAYVRAGKTGVLRGYDWDSGPSGGPPIPVTVNPNTSGQPRIDRIVLRLTRATRLVRAGYVQGTAGSGQPPALTQVVGASGVFEIPWAKVAVANNAVSLTADKVTPEHWCVSDDGAILCTAATMPPYVMPGATVNQVDTGRVYIGTIGPPGGTLSWRLIGDDATATFAPAASWTLTGGLYRRNGLVASTLSVRRNANVGGGANVTVGTVPAGFRPPVDWQAVAVIPNSTAEQVAFANFLASGAVTLTTPNAGGFGANASVAIAASSWPAS